MTLVRGRGRFAQRGQASKAFIRPLFNIFDNENHVNPLKSNKLGLSKTFVGPETLIESVAPAGSI